MFKLNRRNIIALLLALIITAAFTWCVFTTPSLFNALPIEIHDSMGLKPHSESVFVRLFDVCSAIILFILSYIFSRNCFKIYKLF